MASLPPAADDTPTTTTSGAPRAMRLGRLVRLAPTSVVAKERRRALRRIGIAALVAVASAVAASLPASAEEPTGFRRLARKTRSLGCRAVVCPAMSLSS